MSTRGTGEHDEQANAQHLQNYKDRFVPGTMMLNDVDHVMKMVNSKPTNDQKGGKSVAFARGMHPRVEIRKPNQADRTSQKEKNATDH